MRPLDRRDFLAALGLGAFVTAGPALSAVGAQVKLPPMTVYKSASCGCCGNWVDHARAAGFTVRTIDTNDLASVKREMGVPSDLESCHTVVVGNYLVEGHVPAKEVKRMLSTKPAIRGIAVPGMPIGSPAWRRCRKATTSPTSTSGGCAPIRCCGGSTGPDRLCSSSGSTAARTSTGRASSISATECATCAGSRRPIPFS